MNQQPRTKNQQPFGGIYKGKRVFLTGHTGFKGSWMAFWLAELGAKVCGYSLAPPTRPSLFVQLGLPRRLRDVRGDIRDLPRLRRVLREFRPDFVFHLAAQPIVLASYRDTPSTFATNVMGTVFVLEALGEIVGRKQGPRAAVMITSDKVYRPWASPRAHGEQDPLGGVDPYSLSKAACEMAIAAYRHRYPACPVVSARAGNVIGGGDWAPDRIIPDCLRAWAKGGAVDLRHPRAVRPWQHVLEPVSGYLALGAALATARGLKGGRVEGLRRLLSTTQLSNHSTAPMLNGESFNFGPEPGRRWTVQQVVSELARHLGGRWRLGKAKAGHRESHHLEVDSRLARRRIGWRPVWDTRRAVGETARWVQQAGRNPEPITRTQILEYTADAARKAIPWTHT